MNFQNLEYFLVTAEELNITKAAQRLHISQQALSNHIIKLEQELSAKLFDRSRGLSLTYSGKQLKKSAEQILDIKEQAEVAIRDINRNERGELRIGIAHTRGQAILPFLLPKFRLDHPMVDITVVEGSSLLLEEQLSKGQIDLYIGYAPFMLETCETVELMKERMYLLVPMALLKERFGDEKAELVLLQYRKDPDISLFEDLPYVMLQEGDRIRSLVEREFYLRGINPPCAAVTGNIQTACALCAEGMGLTVCPEIYLGSRYTIVSEGTYIRSKIELLEFYGAKNEDTIAIGYNRERYLKSAAEDFIRIAVETLKTGVTGDGSR